MYKDFANTYNNNRVHLLLCGGFNIFVKKYFFRIAKSYYNTENMRKI